MLIDPHRAESAASAESRWWELLPKARDFALLVATLTYGLGYAVWAIFAAKYGLGISPAAQMQYFVAGAPAAFLLACSVALFYWIPLGLDWLRQRMLRSLNRRSQRALQLSFSVIIIVAVLATRYYKSWEVMAGAVLIAMQVLFVGIFEEARRVRVMLILLLPLALIGIHFYATELYEQIPQELGGGQPQCVTINFAGDATSWRDVIIESREAALDRLKPELLRSADGRTVLASRIQEVKELKHLTQLRDVQTGPLLLWRETGTDLLVSVRGLYAAFDDRYLIRRSETTTLRYIGSTRERTEACARD